MPVRGVVIRPGRLNVNRRNCYVVCMVSQRTGQWEIISKRGFRVVCASKLEAREWATLVGSRFWPRPNPHWEDDTYTDWLVSGERMRIEPYEATDPDIGGKAFEIWFHWAVRGWEPGIEDVDTALKGRPMFNEVIRPAWEAARRDR